VAGKGISLCPASAQQFGPRPGIAFVPGKDVHPAAMCVAWRADDTRAIVRRFVELAASLARNP
jgi:hypothetical protein